MLPTLTLTNHLRADGQHAWAERIERRSLDYRIETHEHGGVRVRCAGGEVMSGSGDEVGLTFEQAEEALDYLENNLAPARSRG